MAVVESVVVAEVVSVVVAVVVRVLVAVVVLVDVGVKVGEVVCGTVVVMHQWFEHIPEEHWSLFSHRWPSHWFQWALHFAPPPVQ